VGFIWFWWVLFVRVVLAMAVVVWCGCSGLVWFCVYATKMRVVLDCRGFWWGKIFPNMQKRGIETPFRFFVVFCKIT